MKMQWGVFAKLVVTVTLILALTFVGLASLVLQIVQNHNTQLVQANMTDYVHSNEDYSRSLQQGYNNISAVLDDTGKQISGLVTDLYVVNFSALLSSIGNRIFPYIESYDYDTAMRIITQAIVDNSEVEWITFITSQNPKPSDVFQAGKRSNSENTKVFMFKHPDAVTYLRIEMQANLIGLHGVERVKSLFAETLAENAKIAAEMNARTKAHIEYARNKAVLISEAGATKVKHWISGVMLAVLVLLGICVAIIMRKLVIRPLLHLVNHLLAIEQTGDFSKRARFHRNDEVGQALQAINSLMQSLENAMSRIKQAHKTTDNIFTSMTDTLLVVAATGNITQVNRTDLLGYAKTELIGLPINKVFAQAETNNFTSAKLSTLMQVGSMTNIDATVLNKDGDMIPVLVSSSVLDTSNKNINDVILIIKDITAYRDAKNTMETQSWLAASTTKFTEIAQKARTLEIIADSLICELTPFLAATHGVMYIVDVKTKRYNLMGSYGYEEQRQISNSFALGESLVGQCAVANSIIRFAAPADYIQISSALGKASPLEIITIPISFRENVLAVIEIASFKRFTEQHNLLLEELMPHIALVLENLMRTLRTEALLHQTTTQAKQLRSQQQALEFTNTQLHKERQEVEKKASELALASQYKSEFLATMSHEIRTPMNAIIGLTNLALQQELTPKLEDYLVKVQNASRSLLRLINDILDFSKIESGKLELEAADFRLNEVFDHLADLFRDTAAAKNIELIMWVPRICQDTLIGDSFRLEQILMNLISNAIKFSEAGDIVVQVKQLQSTNDQMLFEFAVQDAGIGLTPAQADKLFTPFVQADGSTTRKYGGSGLGLSICKHLATLMGGKIWVESSPDTGSTFRFTALFAAHKSVPDDNLAVVPMPLQGIEVLVVDDNETARFVLGEILQSYGFVPTMAATGAAAITEVQRAITAGTPHQLVLMDYLMPGMNGVETARVLLKIVAAAQDHNNPPKLLLLTAFGLEKDIVEQARTAGFAAFLAKPVNSSLLFDTIMEMFGQKLAKRYRSKRVIMDTTAITEQVGNSRLLLVEDMPINQQVAREILQGVGIQVDIANDGSEAVRMVADCDYDVVLMDIQMPIMDGYEATRTIRRNPRFAELPIVAMTAHALSSDQEKCRTAGMNDHIGKPIDIEELYTVLTRLIKPAARGADVRAILQEQSKNEMTGGGPNDIPNDLAGIDATAGLQRVGGKSKIYRSLLIEFKRKFSNVAAEIRAALAHEGDREIARSQTHAIKGVAGNLGAHNLYEASRDLEKAIELGDQEELSVMLSGFEKALQQVVESISSLELEVKELHPEDDVVIAAETPLNHAEVMALMTELVDLVAVGNSEAEERLPVLKTALHGATGIADILVQLEECLINFDFKGAQESLMDITRVLDITMGKRT